jgi:hypothetical protein
MQKIKTTFFLSLVIWTSRLLTTAQLCKDEINVSLVADG